MAPFGARILATNEVALLVFPLHLRRKLLLLLLSLFPPLPGSLVPTLVFVVDLLLAVIATTVAATTVASSALVAFRDVDAFVIFNFSSGICHRKYLVSCFCIVIY